MYLQGIPNSSIWLEPFLLILRDSCVWSCPRFYGCDMISLVEGFETVKGNILALPSWLRQVLECQKFEHRIKTIFLFWPNLKCEISRENWSKWKLSHLCICVLPEYMCHHAHYESQKELCLQSSWLRECPRHLWWYQLSFLPQRKFFT